MTPTGTSWQFTSQCTRNCMLQMHCLQYDSHVVSYSVAAHGHLVNEEKVKELSRSMQKKLAAADVAAKKDAAQDAAFVQSMELVLTRMPSSLSDTLTCILGTWLIMHTTSWPHNNRGLKLMSVFL